MNEQQQQQHELPAAAAAAAFAGIVADLKFVFDFELQAGGRRAGGGKLVQRFNHKMAASYRYFYRRHSLRACAGDG